MKPLLSVDIPPQFEKLLHEEVGRDIVRAELREALQPAYTGPVGRTRPAPRPKRRHKPETARLYARLREVPRNVSLEKAAKMFDRKMIPFPVPKRLRDNGWPDTWEKAWKGSFRKKFSDLRGCAWRAQNLPK